MSISCNIKNQLFPNISGLLSHTILKLAELLKTVQEWCIPLLDVNTGMTPSLVFLTDLPHGLLNIFHCFNLILRVI